MFFLIFLQVRFPTEGFGLDLGRKALEELSDRDSLASRKSQLQQELMALKNLLERKQGSTELEEDGNDSQGDDAAKGITSSPVTKQIMTKEELERRKEEAQAIMDLSYWKHFVSKQEHMMAEVDGQVHENSKALNECSIEIEDAVRNLQESELHILDLEKRQQAVAQMVSNATAKLLETRKKLHLEKAKEPAVN